jgi:protein-S-isoprenylcysteine O-methyltransferase Ste14
MRTFFDVLRSLIYATAFIWLWGWLALSVRRYDPALGIVLPAGFAGVGILLMVAGGILALSCVATFAVRGKGTPAPFDAPRQFVAVGPYRYIRNPMYVGALFVMLGFGLYSRSFSVLLLGAGFFSAAFLFVLTYEEPHLRKVFGATYEAYCGSVPRWIPRLPRAQSARS